MRILAVALLGGCLFPTTTTTDTTACVDTDCTPTTTDRPTDTQEPTDGLAPEAPAIEKVVVSAAEITEGESVTVTVTVNDSDGLSTIVGGNVRGPKDQVIEPFLLVSDGVYEATLSWVDIHAAVGIQFESANLDLGLQVAFFDTSSLTGRAGLPLLATCGGLPSYACSGRCVDASTDAAHCGACDNACKSFECSAGSCEVAWSECEVFDTTKHTNCAELCEAAGEVCTDACESDSSAFNSMVRWSSPDCSGGSDYDADLSRCEPSYAWSPSGSTYASVQCCCTSGAVFGP